VRFLLVLEHGVNVNAPDRMGGTPFKMGSVKGHQEIVELLSEYGAE
jgi:ankyrin repeat protein